jgi:hypothetical protein
MALDDIPPQHQHQCDYCRTLDPKAEGWEWVKTESGSLAFCAECHKHLEAVWDRVDKPVAA